MHTLWPDLRYGARMLVKKPGFTLIAVITLALGIGANTAIFTVVNAVLLRPLPYAEPGRIVQLGPEWDTSFMGASEPKFVFWREHSQAFDAVAAIRGVGSGLNLSGSGEPEVVRGMRVSAEFFRVLGVNPSQGRGFTQEEGSPSGERVVILSHDLWQRRFGGDLAQIGKSLLLNDESYIVVGVLPPGFQFNTPADVLLPLRVNPASRDEGHNWNVLGRLKPGVSLPQARADLKLVFEQFKAAYPRMLWSAEQGIRVEPYQALLTKPVSSLLWILLGAVGFVLLIACANVANLQLAQAAARRKELALRQALGAGWRRIARQLLTEGVLLALFGGLAGLLLAVWGVELLQAMMPEGLLPRAKEIGFDWRVLTFTLGTAVFTGLIFALAPALSARRIDINQTLKESGGKGTGGAEGGHMHSALVVAEVALALVLLVGAGLLVRTFANLRQVEPGFDPHNVLTFEVAPNGKQYGTTAAHAEYCRRALERLKSLPGVEGAAVTSNLPLGQYLNLAVEVEGDTNSAASTETRMITPAYFDVLRMKLKQGRTFTEADTANAEPVVIVNEAYVGARLANGDPFGKRLIVQRRDSGALAFRIVGVVNDVKQFGLNSPAPPTIFLPLAQAPDYVLLTARRFVTMKFALRTSVEPLSLASLVRHEMLAVDASLPLNNVRSLEEIVGRSLAQDRFNMTLLGLFAALGLALAAIGIYGVISYSVTQRTHEIGIRLALGAQAADVLKLVVGQGMRLAVIGVVIGVVAAWALTRLLTSLLYGVSATDQLTFIVIALLLTGVGLLACYLPARRATRVDPMIALRYE